MYGYDTIFGGIVAKRFVSDEYFQKERKVSNITE